jgi:hypothetical protein
MRKLKRNRRKRRKMNGGSVRRGREGNGIGEEGEEIDKREEVS